MPPKNKDPPAKEPSKEPSKVSEFEWAKLIARNLSFSEVNLTPKSNVDHKIIHDLIGRRLIMRRLLTLAHQGCWMGFILWWIVIAYYVQIDYRSLQRTICTMQKTLMWR